jgi:hypothetical protein
LNGLKRVREGYSERVGRTRTYCEPPLVAVRRGAIAGAVGTAAMTAYQLAAVKARGSEPSRAPAEVAKRILRGVFQRDVPEDRTELLNNGMHWTYGTGWGIFYGIVAPSLPGSPVRNGIALGLLVWGASLVELPAMKIAPPVWETPPREVVLDASYHLVYGVAVALAYPPIALKSAYSRTEGGSDDERNRRRLRARPPRRRVGG